MTYSIHEQEGRVHLSPFSKINVEDPFFDSLKSDYKNFSSWFSRKSASGESAFVVFSDDRISGFVYVKEESVVCPFTSPPLPESKVLKVGSFKLLSSGRCLGEKFMRRILRYASDINCSHVYFTIFNKYPYAVDVFSKAGFKYHGIKQSENGLEKVYLCEV
jgi:L-amino acid N-acyltransferase YncA